MPVITRSGDMLRFRLMPHIIIISDFAGEVKKDPITPIVNILYRIIKEIYTHIPLKQV
jgi:hypothetical protein